MNPHHLKNLFSPTSICVLGATPEDTNAGRLVINNLIQGGFEGPIMPISQRHQSICGILTYDFLEELPLQPDMAIVCGNDASMEKSLLDLGAAGIKSVMLMSPEPELDQAKIEVIRACYKKYQMRILGPNSVGVMIPRNNLNASRLHLPAKQGKIAFVSQSATISTSVLDWANAHDVGFSQFISLGNGADVGYGDVLDYLGSDPYTRAILVYMESIHERRNFMSAARAAARNKPIIVIKTGKTQETQIITQSHTGAMAGQDLVYDAAFRRAGMLRVNSAAELFASAETLSIIRPFEGKRLAIVSNGAGLNSLASDHLYDLKGELAELSEETLDQIQGLLPKGLKATNPLDIGSNASPKIYGKIYDILKKAREVNCVLFMHGPCPGVDAADCASDLITTFKKTKGNLITCWIGEQSVASSRKLFEQNQVPTYSSPRMAVTAFSHIVRYIENQTTLMETPQRVPSEIKPARSEVRRIIDDALSQGQTWLSEGDVKNILKAYGIDVVEPHIGQSEDEVAVLAKKVGFPVVVKVMSADIVHKSDVGGVVLSLESEEAVRDAVRAIQKRIEIFNPEASINGFIVQKMVAQHNTHELIAGMTNDKVFGPVIMFGEGGTATELIADCAVALPPLNMALAKDLISRTRISRLLSGYRDQPAIHHDALCQLLIELSEICIDFPEIQEFDINPIFCSPQGALAVDSRIKIEPVTQQFPNRRLAIRPYPAHLEEDFTLRDGREVLIRPIRPEDEPAHNEFMSKISAQDIRFRFFGSVRELPHSEMARLTQIDYDREMAFVAQAPNPETGEMETLGVVRTGTDPFNEDAEYAILVRSDLKGQKLGWKLLNKMIDYCRSRGTTYFTGQILRENRTMIDMIKAMGFEVKGVPDEDIVEVRLKL